MDDDIRRIRGIANYQFGAGCGEALFPEGVTITYSKNTGRIRHIYLDGALLASLRPSDGFLTLTMAGAERLVSNIPDPRFTIIITDEVAEFVAQGRSVFARHVIDASGSIRPGDEVVILDQSRRVLAVGQALLNREEMLAFKVGVAVKVRRGRSRDR